MNDRIREIIKQATEHDYTTWDSYNQKELVYYKFNQEKFAELLIKECALIAFHNVVNLSSIADAEDVEANIKQHFGVEA